MSALTRGNITADDFFIDKKAYLFIKDYTKQYGEVPPAEAVVAECENFDYDADVQENINYLVKAVKNNSAKQRAMLFLKNELEDKFSELQGMTFIKWMAEESTALYNTACAESGLGTNYATNGQERLENYKNRKENRTGMFIPTPYPTLNKWLGGGTELSDYVLLNAYTNRGKSWIASQFGLCAWKASFGVLHYSPELSREQQEDRLDTLNGHFSNMALKMGNLYDEDKFESYLEQFNEENETPYIIKTMGDMPKGLSLEVIEADLQANPNIKMVIIDGFNLMTHKGNKGSSNRDNMSNTSRALRQLFGKYKVVGIVVHQTPTSAEKENQGKDESGARIVKPPEIHQYSETIAVVQDACTVLTFDQYDGCGKMKLAKSRTDGVGNELELQVDFNRGYIREVEAVDYF